MIFTMTYAYGNLSSAMTQMFMYLKVSSSKKTALDEHYPSMYICLSWSSQQGSLQQWCIHISKRIVTFLTATEYCGNFGGRMLLPKRVLTTGTMNLNRVDTSSKMTPGQTDSWMLLLQQTLLSLKPWREMMHGGKGHTRRQRTHR